jgi:hypothetical protein
VVESVGASGGFLVFPEHQTQLFQMTDLERIIRQRATVLPMRARVMQVPVLDQTGAPAAGSSYYGGAVAKWMHGAGFGLTLPKHWYRARAWASWGQALDRPAHGCVVVFERKGGGHVGLCVGEAVNGDLLILGGNQGDAVNIRAFPRGRVLAYRWPPGREIPRFTQLAQGTAAATTGEA